MITFQNISYSFDDKDIFRELQLTINPGDRIALIGDNGTGKTTLLRLAVGEIKPSESVVTNSFMRTGYVRQVLAQHESVALLFDGCEHWRVLAALNDMSLDEKVLGKSIGQLSGGQATKVQLAAILARKFSDVLILDEPTNNLDREAVEWLETFLAHYKGAVLAASHDRSFIDQFATKIGALKDQSVTVYNGNYTSYMRELDRGRAHQLQEYEKEQKEKQKLKRLLVDAQVSASSDSRAKNRDNDKMLRNFKLEGKQVKSGQEVHRMQMRLQSVEKTQKIVDPKIYKTSLAATSRRSGLVLNVEKLSKSVFNLSDQSFTLHRGQRLYVAGKNGSGKSTLLNVLTGRDSEYEGAYKWSPSAQVGYFSQDVYGIDKNLSVLEVLSGYYEDTQDMYKQCKTLGLSPQDVHRKVSTLSRGQQAKVGFVSLLLQSYDVLVLDEPTNHLDISSRTIIEDALARYEGAIMYTSHDRFFVEQVGYEELVSIG